MYVCNKHVTATIGCQAPAEIHLISSDADFCVPFPFFRVLMKKPGVLNLTVILPMC
jgi:hypothetical protein